jgi:hypothetical protein
VQQLLFWLREIRVVRLCFLQLARRTSEIHVRVMGQVDHGEQGLWDVSDVVVAVDSRRRKVIPRIDGS